MPAILVQDPQTGEQRSVDESIVRANPEAYTLVEGQTLGVRAGDIGGLRQQEVTPETVRAQTFERAAPAEVTEATRAAVAEERHGGILDQVKGGVEAFAESATFGLSALATRPDTAIGREEAREAREVQSTARTIGGIAGAVIPGLVSGGTGAAATIARLTPAGRMTAATMRMASKGGFARAAAGAGLEGFAGAAGDYIARTSLDENPDFSASAIVGAGLEGGALGLALGGAGELIGRGAAKLGKRLTESRIGKLLDDVPISSTPAVKPRSLVSGAEKAPKRFTSYKRLVHKRLADDSAGALRSMGTRIDDVVNRGFAGEIDELVSMPGFADIADDATTALVTEAKDVAGRLGQSTEITKEWFGKYSDAVGLPNASKRLTKRAGDDLEEMGAATIAETDELTTKFDRLMDELHAKAGIPSTRAPQVGDEAGGMLGDAVVEEGKRKGFISRAGEVAATAGGVAEIAGAMGIEGVPTPTNLLGPLAGAYFKYKGLRAAVRGAGLIPASKATRAAQGTVSMAERISSKAQLVAGGLLKKIGRAPAIRIVPTQIATRIGAINALDPSTVGANAALELEGTTAAVQASAGQTAARAVQYLQETAPRDPIPNRPPWMSTWTPSVQESMDYSRRLGTVENPDAAINTLLASSSYSIELEALSAVYPPLVAQLRNDLLANSEELTKNLDVGALARISRALSLPLTVEMAVPSYGAIPIQQMAPEPQPQFSRPSTPGASPSVRLESTERRAPR